MLSQGLSIVVPCYREQDVIATTLDTLTQFVSPLFEHYEIIVVTDGSPDHTPQSVKTYQASHPTLPVALIEFPMNCGKGAAVKAGFLHAQYDWVLMIDADLTIGIEELNHFIPFMNQSDMIIASRMASGSHFEEPIPLYRSLLTRFFQILQMILLGNFEFSDTQCGFKLFRRSTVLPLVQVSTIERFAFDAELLFLTKQKNLRVTILPVTIHKDKRNTNVRILHDPLNMFFALLKIRWNSFIGRYRQSTKHLSSS
jgi:dolichyl-phosphate beta-glucosyltransferase